MLPCRPSSLAALFAPLALATLVLAACGGGGQPGTVLPDGGLACVHNFDCRSGQGCINNVCQALPCGGCQPDQACADNGTCVNAQGASCPSVGCPSGYSCNGTVCTKPCTLDADCGTGFVCNSGLKQCAQCTFDNQCAGVAGKPRCDSTSGTCVSCLNPIDCSHGNFCNTTSHQCVPGCQVDGDCNVSIGEHCSGATASAPGQCIQCTKATEKTDCTAQGFPACDSTGHCVACVDDTYCTPGVPRCDTSSKSCVACLPANDAVGGDCGTRFYNGGPQDSHDQKTCNPSSHSCVAGCAHDTQCGCPRNADGTESNCPRYPHNTCFNDTQCNVAAGDHCCTSASGTCVTPSGGTPGQCIRNHAVAVVSGEYCDTAKTTNSDGNPALGACVECLVGHNDQCRYRVHGSTQFQGAYASLTGSRCVADFCVEGCDSNADCQSGKQCHLGSPGDPNNNKCVDCSCGDGTSTQDNGSWCPDTTDCPNIGSGPSLQVRVCDAHTLSCRSKRFNETCSATTECGDINDPAVAGAASSTCVPVPAVCVKLYQPTTLDSVNTQCRTPGLPYGRCGIPCQDFTNNLCDANSQSTGQCPNNSICRGVDDSAGGHGKYCVPPSCR